MSRNPSLKLKPAKKRTDTVLSLVYADSVPSQSPPAGARDRLQHQISSSPRESMAPIPRKRSSDTRSLLESVVTKRPTLGPTPPATTSAVTATSAMRAPLPLDAGSAPSDAPSSSTAGSSRDDPYSSGLPSSSVPHQTLSRWFGKQTTESPMSASPNLQASTLPSLHKDTDVVNQPLPSPPRESAPPTTAPSVPTEPLPAIQLSRNVSAASVSAGPKKLGWFGGRNGATAQASSAASAVDAPAKSQPGATSPPSILAAVSKSSPAHPVQIVPPSSSTPSTTAVLGGKPITRQQSTQDLERVVAQGDVQYSPSPARYAIGIPLLGRQKVPLEALKQAERLSVGNTEETMEVPSPQVPIPDSQSIQDNDQVPLHSRQASSWLDYLWSAPPTTTLLSVSLPSSPPRRAAELPPSPTTSVPNLPSTDVDRPTPPSESRQQQSWLASWVWREPTSSAVPVNIPDVQSGGAKTFAASSSPAPDALSLPDSPSLLIRTPDQRASWVTYFSSRGRMPAKKMHREEGVEVMEIDEDAASLSGQSATSAVSRKPPVKPITDSDSIRNKVAAARPLKGSSPAPSKAESDKVTKKSAGTGTATGVPNLILPSFEDTFKSGVRASAPPMRSTLQKTIGIVRNSLFSREGAEDRSNPLRRSILAYDGHKPGDRRWARQLPRTWDVLSRSKGTTNDASGLLHGCKRVAIIGVHGWFPGAIVRTVFGEPTGTSSKFATMMETAVRQFMEKHNHTADVITCMPLEGEGTIERRVEKLYQDLMSHEDWVDDLHEADVVFIATHSQGSVASTHLLTRLIKEGHIRVAPDETGIMPSLPTMPTWAGWNAQRICCLALCGIHLGPLMYLQTSSIVQPYLQYFESAAAKELFEFQDISSNVSKQYMETLRGLLDRGVRFVYIASLDDQVVPIYSGVFTSINHPGVLRALYIDGDAYSSSDFLSNLLILLIRLRNAGIDDAGLIAHLSEATAGSVSGVGHSTAYEELGVYSLAVRYMFESSGVLNGPAELAIEPFSPRAPRNDYEIPWALRHILADPRVGELFGHEFLELRAAFDDWQPKTAALRDIRRKLEPIRRLPSSRL
ncbi:hypothetical protein BKA62DRAFT_143365 [Auriculariales sp. MPI-PUGE-AT-0066]|nr:hypothetical protein BKA62DRAFT_143365 [Auriculariales sp. MPI-PUGE-AT-0066]